MVATERHDMAEAYAMRIVEYYRKGGRTAAQAIFGLTLKRHPRASWDDAHNAIAAHHLRLHGYGDV